jgi:hypothetical protein
MVNLTNPMRDVINSAHADVLRVLVRTDQPLSGRRVADLTDGGVKHVRATQILNDLTRAGIVVREDRPPAQLFTLNRDHVAAPAIEALATQQDLLWRRTRELVATWNPAAAAVWLFGSAARGAGTTGSDIDLLVLRPDDVDDGSDAWLTQISELASKIWTWSGNSCEVLELSSTEFHAMVDGGHRLAHELRADAVVISGTRPADLIPAGATA